MSNIDSYKKRFYGLMESTMANVYIYPDGRIERKSLI